MHQPIELIEVSQKLWFSTIYFIRKNKPKSHVFDPPKYPKGQKIDNFF